MPVDFWDREVAEEVTSESMETTYAASSTAAKQASDKNDGSSGSNCSSEYSDTSLHFGTKRREKLDPRRVLEHFSNPLHLIALAVQFDESRGDERLLWQPLESARLYDRSQFAQALEYLLRWSERSTTLHGRRETSRDDKSLPTDLPGYALTPVILSGLLTAIQQRQRDDEWSSNAQNISDIGSELVTACQAMRNQAIARGRKWHRRRKRLFWVLPILFVISGIVLYEMYVRRIRFLLDRLHIGESCESLGHYKFACRESEAALWERFQESMESSASVWFMEIDSDHNHDTILLPLQDAEKRLPAPLAIHTQLSQPLISLNDLNYRPTVDPYSAHRSGVDRPKLASEEFPLSWLGETGVTRLVREVVYAKFKASRSISVLDVGCGVGGLLYTLMPISPPELKYHGISISGAEVSYAQKVGAHFGVDRDDVSFHHRSFDDSLPQETYDVVVAVESLTYSHAINKTLDNMLQSLKRGGLLIVVDDVLHSESMVSRSEARPTYTHQSWLDLFESRSCPLLRKHDLSLEYELDGLTTSQPHASRKIPAGRRLGLSLWRYAFRTLWLVVLLMGTDQRAAQLNENLVELAERRRGRRDDYWKVSKAYHMYVCVKN